MQQGLTLGRRAFKPLLGWLTALMIAALVVPAGTAGAYIQTLTGNYVYQWSDVRPVGGGPLHFQRTYNSLASSSTSLGPGWTHIFDAHLARPINRGPNDFLFVGPSGRHDVYTSVGDRMWAPPPLVEDRLIKDERTYQGFDVYVLEQQDGTTYWFDQGGRPFQIRFKDETSVGLRYDAQRRLERVTAMAPHKGVLTFAHDDAGKLVSVSDGEGSARAVHFDYDGLGRLVSVTNRVGQVTTYTYHGETSHLREIIDARGHVAIAMTYDEQGRTVSQANARSIEEGKTLTFEYTTLDDGRHRSISTEPPSSFAPDSPTRKIDTYDDQRRISQSVTELGPGDEPVVQTYGPHRLAAWAVVKMTGGKTPAPGAGGEEISSYAVPGLRDQMDVEVGKPLMGAIVGPPQVDGLPRQYLAELNRQAEERTNDRYGRLVGVSLPGSAGPRAGAWRIEYDDEDRVVALKQATGDRSMTFQYDPVGNLVEIARGDGQVRQFEYDNRDALIKYTDEAGVTRQYEYEERYWTTKMIETPANGGPSRVVEYENDGLGRLRVMRDFEKPDAPVEIELSYDLLTVTGIWQR